MKEEERPTMLEFHYWFFLMIGSNFSFVAGPAKWIIKWKHKNN